jgi:hypothetical protein
MQAFDLPLRLRSDSSHQQIRLSDEQHLLASIVHKNPAAHLLVRRRASALLLLNDKLTIDEVHEQTGLLLATITAIVNRFRRDGLCAALLGEDASFELKVWLELAPNSLPMSVRAQSRQITKQPIDTFQ